MFNLVGGWWWAPPSNPNQIITNIIPTPVIIVFTSRSRALASETMFYLSCLDLDNTRARQQTNKHEPSHPYIHEYMLLSGGKGKEVSGSLSPLPAESKVFVYKLVGVSGWGARAPTLPTYQHKLVTRNPGDLSGGRGASLPFLPPLSSPGYRVTSKYWMIVGGWEGSGASLLPSQTPTNILYLQVLGCLEGEYGMKHPHANE